MASTTEQKEQPQRSLVSDIEQITAMDTSYCDLLIESGSYVMAKGPAGWVEVSGMSPVTSADIECFLFSTNLQFEESLRQKKAVNFGYELPNARLRINAFAAQARDNYAMAIRVIPKAIPALKDTGLPTTSMADILPDPRGIILVSGPVGSGKSTTLASIIEELNQTRNGHIITLEDPIEYTFTRKQSIITQRQIGVDVGSFNEGVYDAMRQRPSAIMIGEIRNRETAEAALLAAESGVLVLGTLHANDAPGTIQKLLSFFPADERAARLHTLDTTLLGVISQILVPDAKCEKWLLASEILSNKDRRLRGLLDDEAKLRADFARYDFHQSMEQSFTRLIRSGATTTANAVAVLRDPLRGVISGLKV